MTVARNREPGFEGRSEIARLLSRSLNHSAQRRLLNELESNLAIWRSRPRGINSEALRDLWTQEFGRRIQKLGPALKRAEEACSQCLVSGDAERIERRLRGKRAPISPRGFTPDPGIAQSLTQASTSLRRLLGALETIGPMRTRRATRGQPRDDDRVRCGGETLQILKSFGVPIRKERPIVSLVLVDAGHTAPEDLDDLMKASREWVRIERYRARAAP